MREKTRQITFVRWGALSSQNQKGRYLSDNKLKTAEQDEVTGVFHRPPAKKGIYCFVDGFVEMFLVGWKMYREDGSLKKEYEHPKRFNYTGKIWTHIYHPAVSGVQYFRTHGSWYETHTDCLKNILEEEKKRLNKESWSRDSFFWGEKRPEFHRMIEGYTHFSKDHFEMFIEKIH